MDYPLPRPVRVVAGASVAMIAPTRWGTINRPRSPGNVRALLNHTPELTSELPLCIHIACLKRVLVENEVDRYANDLFTDGLDSVNKPTVDVARLSTSVSMVRNNTHVDYGATRHAGTQNQTAWNLPVSTQGDSSVPPPPPYSGSPPPTGLPQPNDRLPVAPPWSPL